MVSGEVDVDRQPWRIRMRDSAGRVVGAGFLIDSRHVLTCAHVVNAAAGQPGDCQELPKAVLQVDLVGVENQASISGTVLADGWRPIQSDGRDDVAVVRLDEDVATTVKPAPMRRPLTLWNHRFRTYGFPPGYENGVWAEGKLSGPSGPEQTWIQLGAVRTSGYRVQKGFSGAAVWDEEEQGVVGMVVADDRVAETKVAWMLPTKVLAAAWPPLADQGIEQTTTWTPLPKQALQPSLSTRERERPERSKELPTVAAVDKYTVGVSPSSHVRNDPYVPRRVDGRLEAALKEHSFVLVVGRAAAGASRTAFQAVRNVLRTAKFLAPNPGRLEELLAPNGSLELPSQPLVVWLDGLDRHLGPGGLQVSLLDRIAEVSHRVVVVATMSSWIHTHLLNTGLEPDDVDLDGTEAYQPGWPVRQVLARATTIKLTSSLTNDEFAIAQQLYPDKDLDDRPVGHHLGRWLIGALGLQNAYVSDDVSLFDRDAGRWRKAVVQAAVDWRRTGMCRPAPEAWLRSYVSSHPPRDVEKKTPLYDPVIDPVLNLNPQSIIVRSYDEKQDPIRDAVWSAEGTPWRAPVKLLRPYAQGEGVAYEVPNYLIDFDEGEVAAAVSDPSGQPISNAARVRPIPAAVWSSVLQKASPPEQLMVGLTAYARGELGVATQAWELVRDSRHPEVAPVAMCYLGLLLRRQGNLEHAETVLWQAIDSTHRDMAPAAALILGTLLYEQGGPSRVEDARALLEQAARSAHHDIALKALHLLRRLDDQVEGTTS